MTHLFFTRGTIRFIALISPDNVLPVLNGTYAPMMMGQGKHSEVESWDVL